MPHRGLRLAVVLVAALASPAASACDVPDEGGNTPWRRAVAKVRYQPDVEAWASAMTRDGHLVQYAVLLDQPATVAGRCYWPVEVRAGGTLWKRFLVAPDGTAMREDKARR